MTQLVNVPVTDNFEQWRQKTNTIATQVGDLDNLTTDVKTSVVDAINNSKYFAIAMAIALS